MNVLIAIFGEGKNLDSLQMAMRAVVVFIATLIFYTHIGAAFLWPAGALFVKRRLFKTLALRYRKGLIWNSAGLRSNQAAE